MNKLQANTPAVPVGIATKTGLIAGALASLLAVITLVLHGDHSEETLGALITAGLSFYGVVSGRSAQAAANTAAAATVVAAQATATLDSEIPAEPAIIGGKAIYQNATGGADLYYKSPVKLSFSKVPMPDDSTSSEEDRDAIAEQAAAELTEDVRMTDPSQIPADEGQATAVPS